MIKILKEHGIIPALVCFLTIISVDMWSKIPIGKTVLRIGVPYILICLSLAYKELYFAPGNRKDYRIVTIFFLWTVIGAIRGAFVAENWPETQDLITGFTYASVPVIVYIFSSPDAMWKTLHLWVWFAIPLFFVLYSWMLARDAYQFYFGPLFLICFIPALPGKWKIALSVILLLMLGADLSARSQMIKAAVVTLICAAYLLRRFIPVVLYRAVHWLCYIVPVAILYLAISGIFNPFERFSEQAEKSAKGANEINGANADDVTGDTRTDLYKEVVESAVKHDYIWCGRTLARGNDSWVFGAYQAEEMKTGKYERYGNEMCHPNIFTWLGLVGVILYALVYLKSSYLALYKSNSIWLKLIGVFIAFNWAYGWIENTVEFNIMNIGIWMMIAMGFSEEFRAMSDNEMEDWIRSVFRWKSAGKMYVNNEI